jgi:LuxR family quorum sensing-dependent transcriptional regulator
MLIANSLVADSERFRDMSDGARILAYIEDRFRALGATHFLATGLPLPGRPIEPLILRLNWGDLRGERGHASGVEPHDPMLQLALRSRRAFTWSRDNDPGQIAERSALVQAVDAPKRVAFVGVPIQAFPPYQAGIIAAGPTLWFDSKAMLAIDYFCTEGFRRLLVLGFMRPDRPGDLSAREKKVVELSAVGKTAGEIAGVLKISQRTVHAHLQNASEKLHASNKTHTVVEALRYGQISV